MLLLPSVVLLLVFLLFANAARSLVLVHIHIYPHFRACFSFGFYIYGKWGEGEKQTEGTDGYYQICLIYICLFFLYVECWTMDDDGGLNKWMNTGVDCGVSAYIVSELKIPGVDAPKETPGRGKGFAYIIRYDASKARKVLGVEFRDNTTTTKDTIEDFKARGWLNWVEPVMWVGRGGDWKPSPWPTWLVGVGWEVLICRHPDFDCYQFFLFLRKKRIMTFLGDRGYCPGRRLDGFGLGEKGYW